MFDVGKNSMVVFSNGKWKTENGKLRQAAFIFHFPFSIFHFLLFFP